MLSPKARRKVEALWPWRIVELFFFGQALTRNTLGTGEKVKILREQGGSGPLSWSGKMALLYYCPDQFRWGVENGFFHDSPFLVWMTVRLCKSRPPIIWSICTLIFGQTRGAVIIHRMLSFKKVKNIMGLSVYKSCNFFFVIRHSLITFVHGSSKNTGRDPLSVGINTIQLVFQLFRCGFVRLKWLDNRKLQ